MDELFEVARTSWAQAGRPKPRLTTSFGFALGAGDDAQRCCGRHRDRLVDVLASLADIGTDVVRHEDEKNPSAISMRILQSHR